ncbi:putative hydroxysteroid dehydrogenase [Myxozyma melibiosi]|uniref:Hydroxysteroid dehydrogenase n=1 Tax=Myxozyma melibiosi TaxID=54550 RepID=A0ABR1F5M5_9ASCO
MPLTILLTGGTGCVGYAVTKALFAHYAASKPTLHILDIATPSPSASTFVVDVAQYHTADITDAAAVSALIASLAPDVIVHSAAVIPSAAGKARMSKQRLREVNVGGTRNVLEAAEKCGNVKAVVYTSSCDAVKPDSWMDFVNATEKDTADLVDAAKWDGDYARTKADAEKLVLSSSWHFNTCAIRTHAVIGTHDQNLFPLIATSPRNISIGSGKNLYDFTSADNVGLAHVLAVDNLLSASATANRLAFFVTDGDPRPFRELQEMIWRTVDSSSSSSSSSPPSTSTSYTKLPSWLVAGILRFIALFTTPAVSAAEIGDACATRYYDISLAKEVLGYVPGKTLLESMADDCLSWRARMAENK